MELSQAWPPFGLRLQAGPLVLRPMTDDVLPGLIEVALGGVHDPAVMPFAFPWTDVPPDQLPANYVRYNWGVRSAMSPERWTLDFAVEWDDELVGVQGIATSDYLVTRTGETGSWLGRRFQGRGIGTAMRQAMCAFCFDHLDAEQITSVAYTDNPASNGVSRKVGYQPNGVFRRVRRPGEWCASQELMLTPDAFVRGEPLTVAGASEFRRFIGLDAPAV